jgi:hypothetical protein
VSRVVVKRGRAIVVAVEESPVRHEP